MSLIHSVSVVEYIRTSLLNPVILMLGAEIKPFYGMIYTISLHCKSIVLQLNNDDACISIGGLERT